MTESESVSHCVVSDFLLPQGILRQEYWSELPSSSRGSSQPRDRTCVSYIVGGFVSHWATWEALVSTKYNLFLIDTAIYRIHLHIFYD